MRMCGHVTISVNLKKRLCTLVPRGRDAPRDERLSVSVHRRARAVGAWGAWGCERTDETASSEGSAACPVAVRPAVTSVEVSCRIRAWTCVCCACAVRWAEPHDCVSARPDRRGDAMGDAPQTDVATGRFSQPSRYMSGALIDRSSVPEAGIQSVRKHAITIGKLPPSAGTYRWWCSPSRGGA